MDNQPTQPGASSPEAPANPNPNPTQPVQPTANPSTPPPVQSATETPTPPTGLPATGDVVLESGKKKKKGLIAAIIAVVAVLLIGGGTFAALYIINNQPANILASSLNNLFNAKQIEIGGAANLALQNSNSFGIESINLTFNNKAAGISNATTASLSINLTNGTTTPAIEFGEVLLSDGVLYIEANNLKEFYDEAFRDYYKEIVLGGSLYSYKTTTYDCDEDLATEELIDCLEESLSDVESETTTESAASDAIDEILDQIGEIIESIDGQWIEISIDDVLDSEMFESMSSKDRRTISDAYKCTINTLNQASNYSDEFSNFYSQNSFINMTAGNNSFYNISLDATNLTGYLNAMSSTKFASDIATCYNTNISENSSKLTVDNVSSMLENIPQISARFDGIFDHHLTELKMSEQNDYYSLDADLTFSYPNNIVVNAPSDSRPAMDIVEEIYQGMINLQEEDSL